KSCRTTWRRCTSRRSNEGVREGTMGPQRAHPILPGMSDYDLMEAQADALFTYDESGRMLRLNEPDGPPAPRFFLGRTRGGHVWRLRHHLPERLARALYKWAAAEPTGRELRELPLHVDRYCELLRAHAEI